MDKYREENKAFFFIRQLCTIESMKNTQDFSVKFSFFFFLLLEDKERQWIPRG